MTAVINPSDSGPLPSNCGYIQQFSDYIEVQWHLCHVVRLPLNLVLCLVHYIVARLSIYRSAFDTFV